MLGLYRSVLKVVKENVTGISRNAETMLSATISLYNPGDFSSLSEKVLFTQDMLAVYPSLFKRVIMRVNCHPFNIFYDDCNRTRTPKGICQLVLVQQCPPARSAWSGIAGDPFAFPNGRKKNCCPVEPQALCFVTLKHSTVYSQVNIIVMDNIVRLKRRWVAAVTMRFIFPELRQWTFYVWLNSLAKRLVSSLISKIAAGGSQWYSQIRMQVAW